MLQAQYQPQQPFLREPKLLHVRARSRSAQHSRQSDNQNLQQIVSGVLGPRIRQGPESLPEMAHRTPSSIREPPSESSFRANAIGASNAYAIPLPLWGRDRERGRTRTASVCLLLFVSLQTSRALRSVFGSEASPCPSPTRGEGTLWHCSAQKRKQHSRTPFLRELLTPI